MVNLKLDLFIFLMNRTKTSDDEKILITRDFKFVEVLQWATLSLSYPSLLQPTLLGMN